LAFWNRKNKAAEAEQKENRAALFESVLQSRYAEFFYALDIPRVHAQVVSKEDATKCGRLIMNYIVHNPEESKAFARALLIDGDPRLRDPVWVATHEAKAGGTGPVHQLTYRAIETLVSNNTSLFCFGAVDCMAVMGKRALMEMGIWKPGAAGTA
jgi:hypothetical protein